MGLLIKFEKLARFVNICSKLFLAILIVLFDETVNSQRHNEESRACLNCMHQLIDIKKSVVRKSRIELENLMPKQEAKQHVKDHQTQLKNELEEIKLRLIQQEDELCLRQLEKGLENKLRKWKQQWLKIELKQKKFMSIRLCT